MLLCEGALEACICVDTQQREAVRDKAFGFMTDPTKGFKRD